MSTKQKRKGAAVLVLLFSLWACPGDRGAEEPGPGAEATQLSPEQQMETSLQQVVEAQAAYYEEHETFADSIQILIDDYDFQPVGEAQVALSFAERATSPQWGYVATAVHPFSNQRCEVLHGRTTDGRAFAGQIMCEGPEQGPPQPAHPPVQGEEVRPTVEPQSVAPGSGPDAERTLPRTEIDTVQPAQHRP